MSPRRIAGFGSIALGTGIAAAAVLGPLVFKVIEFRTSKHIENQFVGGEVVSLGVVAPAAVAAGVLWLRGHRLAPALALGPSLYAVYTSTTAILGQEYSRYPGNVEKFFPLYAGLVAGGTALAAYAWSQLGERDLRMPSDSLRRAAAGIFLGLGVFFALAWSAQIRLVVIGHPSAEYQEGPSAFWIVKLLDFGFVIPLLIVTGIGLFRGRPAAIRAAYGLAAFATCLAGSIAGMAVAMSAKHDPSAQPAMLVVVLPATAGLALITARLLRSFACETDGLSQDKLDEISGRRRSSTEASRQPSPRPS
ncbi:MAG: hypothetical protein QOF01_5376 [Thermomicrobiales bacterium]|jgi:hypothetical protein|nr:hypothetical protein [Thermomicrobiales bacterium]MEA2598907.1 hypothetical protein [Thermomicrobiales bacterium]